MMTDVEFCWCLRGAFWYCEIENKKYLDSTIKFCQGVIRKASELSELLQFRKHLLIGIILEALVLLLNLD